MGLLSGFIGFGVAIMVFAGFLTAGVFSLSKAVSLPALLVVSLLLSLSSAVSAVVAQVLATSRRQQVAILVRPTVAAVFRPFPSPVLGPSIFITLESWLVIIFPPGFLALS